MVALLRLAAFALVVLVGQDRAAFAQSENDEAQRGAAIESGYVVVEGRYLPPPYHVAADDDQLFIGDVAFPRDAFAPRDDWRGPFPRRRWGFDNPQAQVERLLLSDVLILRFSDGETIVVRDAHDALQALLSDKPPEDKLRRLMREGPERITSDRWMTLIENFQPTDDLRRRLEEESKRQEAQRPSDNRQRSATAIYLFNILGMFLTVYAFGVVVGRRPPSSASWRDEDRSPESVQVVIRGIKLLVMVSAFDLACTYFAGRAGGFWEVNPIGAALLESTIALVAFKTGWTLLSIVILYLLRFRHGAQIASWWISVVLALLTARWVMFNSMLLG